MSAKESAWTGGTHLEYVPFRGGIHSFTNNRTENLTQAHIIGYAVFGQLVCGFPRSMYQYLRKSFRNDPNPWVERFISLDRKAKIVGTQQEGKLSSRKPVIEISTKYFNSFRIFKGETSCL